MIIERIIFRIMNLESRLREDLWHREGFELIIYIPVMRCAHPRGTGVIIDGLIRYQTTLSTQHASKLETVLPGVKGRNGGDKLQIGGRK